MADGAVLVYEGCEWSREGEWIGIYREGREVASIRAKHTQAVEGPERPPRGKPPL